MQFKIIKTGSGGNAYLFDENIMIDCGLPFSHFKDVDFSKIDYILLTHIHGDHYNSSTIRNIALKHKHIKFIFGEWLKEELRLTLGGKVDNVRAIEMDKPYRLGEVVIAGFNAPHDVPNCGYRLMKGKYKHIHVTDISTLYGIEAISYDSATIECNHDWGTAIAIAKAKSEEGAFTHLWKALKSHIDVDEVLKWCDEQGIKNLTPIHIGKSTSDEVMKKFNDWRKDEN